MNGGEVLHRLGPEQRDGQRRRTVSTNPLIHASEDLLLLIADQNEVGTTEVDGELYAVVKRPDGGEVTFTTARVPQQRSGS